MEPTQRTLLLLLVAGILGTVALGTTGSGDWSLTGATVPEQSQTPLVEPGSLSVTPVPTGSDGSGVRRSFVWRYGDRSWSHDLSVGRGVYGYYVNRTRPDTADYSVYVTDPVDDAAVEALAASFAERSEREGFSQGETVAFVASFVQSLRYTPDDVSTSMDEYPRYPVETLVEEGGDCEDTSILLTAVLNAMGYDTVLLELPTHMAVGVAVNDTGGYAVEHGGTLYRYVETTGKGWGVGDVPERFADDPVTVRDLDPAPVLTHSWDAVVTDGRVAVAVTVRNVGSASATGARVRYSFETGGAERVAETSGPVVIGTDGSETFRTELSPPSGETRLVVEVLMDGEVVDRSRSEPFAV